ncbi:LytTR family DNA-binding domain-containing protein [Emticicia sp. BO119]|uniref:LytR/AlgR family response regulator transcription factor n=1 Tax=Emticicia sp. BO119 TaxID=2757768 RepID=UPI0015F0920A|nr:LytTR family DNA-binding domain-containing protein [Emticicia sp. BO119]MBA4853868.1 LytTR family transcriptional regulator [Emticicia sp. BO119]MBA4854117.1 LytTR family transcriptional regulator [Emticicia sp. BO119]
MNNELLIPFGGRLKIDPTTVLLLKADINYTQVYLEDGSTVLSSVTLGTLAKRLQQFPFFRPNRSVLINLSYIVGYEQSSSQIKMGNNEIYKISRRRTKHFQRLSGQSAIRATKELSW